MVKSRTLGWKFGLVIALALCLPVSAAACAVPSVLPDAPSIVKARELRSSRPPRHASAPASPDRPQSASPNSANWLLRGLKRGLQDQREIYSAPLHRSAAKWDLAFAGLTAGLIAADRHAAGALPRDHLEVSRHISDIGLYSMTATVGGLWLTSQATKDPHAREAGTLGLEALANTAAVYSVLQFVAGRERPLEGDGKGHFWKNNSLSSSFPSGHAAFTWTTASVIAHEYPKPWVEALVYGAATAVSVTRFTGLKHFPADVVVGSTFGYFIGRHIFHSHCKAGLSPACGPSSLQDSRGSN